MFFLLKGIILGFSIAAPVGPIGVLCIQRTLSEGRLHGFVSGLGAATADSIYGFIGAFGLSAISSFLIGYRWPIHIVGGIFLLYLALKIWLSKPSQKSASSKQTKTLAGSYLSTVFLTITNPMTIFSFIAAFAALGIATTAGHLAPALIIVGVFVGSAFWWLILSFGVGLLKHKLDENGMLWINRISAVLILILLVISFLRK
ncbi:MAG: Lysine exporter protein [Patescibacteria group bacterium]|nr:Lysine exporter protein [Patescibacteria group bacterium]